jgi:hypothetical protein
MDWSSRDVIAAAWPQMDGHVSLVAVGGAGASSELAPLPSRHPIAAVKWDERGDTLLTVDTAGGYAALHCTLPPRTHTPAQSLRVHCSRVHASVAWPIFAGVFFVQIVLTNSA